MSFPATLVQKEKGALPPWLSAISSYCVTPSLTHLILTGVFVCPRAGRPADVPASGEPLPGHGRADPGRPAASHAAAADLGLPDGLPAALHHRPGHAAHQPPLPPHRPGAGALPGGTPVWSTRYYY